MNIWQIMCSYAVICTVACGHPVTEPVSTDAPMQSVELRANTVAVPDKPDNAVLKHDKKPKRLKRRSREKKGSAKVHLFRIGARAPRPIVRFHGDIPPRFTEWELTRNGRALVHNTLEDVSITVGLEEAHPDYITEVIAEEVGSYVKPRKRMARLVKSGHYGTGTHYAEFSITFSREKDGPPLSGYIIAGIHSTPVGDMFPTESGRPVGKRYVAVLTLIAPPEHFASLQSEAFDMYHRLYLYVPHPSSW